MYACRVNIPLPYPCYRCGDGACCSGWDSSIGWDNWTRRCRVHSCCTRVGCWRGLACCR